jgi:acylphosphatase
MKKRIRYNFTGSVQGVGFRYSASNAARALGLTGWVCNEFNGSVTMEVQGEDEAIRALIVTIEKSPYISIDNVGANELPLDPEEKSFRIRI